MQLTAPDGATIRIEAQADPEARFEQVCRDNPEARRIEQTTEGEIIVTPPAGNESSHRNISILLHLELWNRQRPGYGYCFGPDTVFVLPDKSKKGADATWIRRKVVEEVPASQRRKFMPVIPDFVIELKSPTDRLSALQHKMEAWIANGVPLGWLIDADTRQAWVYTPDAITFIDNPSVLCGMGSVEGFVLPMAELYRGLAG